MDIINVLKDYLQQGLTFVSAFNLNLCLILFVICLMGEAFGIFIPYLFETILLLIGYYFHAGNLTFFELLLLFMATEGGRIAGAWILYLTGRGGTAIAVKVWHRFKPNKEIKDSFLSRLFSKINLLNPFSVALGRLLWLRIPLTFILSAKRDLKTLVLAVSISTLIYDGLYITIGALLGTTTNMEPLHLLPYMVAILTILYFITAGIKKLMKIKLKNGAIETSIKE